MSIKPVWLARTIAAILLIIAIATALCAAILLPFFLAKWFANIPLLAFISLLSCCIVIWVGVRVFGMQSAEPTADPRPKLSTADH